MIIASYGGPAVLASRLNASPGGWNASGDLSFLNSWTYKLGEEILTPFGRQQLYDLGVSMRMKYGFLLNVEIIFASLIFAHERVELHRE